MRECWDIESAMILGEGCRDSLECFDCVPAGGESCFDFCQTVYECVCVCVCVCVSIILCLCSVLFLRVMRLFQIGLKRSGLQV